MKMSLAIQKALPTKTGALVKAASSGESSKASGPAAQAVPGQALAVLLLALVLLCSCSFGTVEGLKCHMCGQYNEGVGSITPCLNYSKEIEHLYLKECTKKSEKYCVKYVSELSTVRDCATECVEKEIWETQTYCCTEDGCNSCGCLKYSIVMLIMPILIWLF